MSRVTQFHQACYEIVLHFPLTWKKRFSVHRHSIAPAAPERPAAASSSEVIVRAKKSHFLIFEFPVFFSRNVGKVTIHFESLLFGQIVRLDVKYFVITFKPNAKMQSSNKNSNSKVPIKCDTIMLFLVCNCVAFSNLRHNFILINEKYIWTRPIYMRNNATQFLGKAYAIVSREAISYTFKIC